MNDQHPQPTAGVWTDRELPSSRRGRRTWRWVALAVAAVAIATGAVFGSRIGNDPTLVESPLIGKPAPAQRLPKLDGGGALSLKQFRGRVLVVNFWASWCVECRKEQPTLTAAADAYGPSGAVFLGISYQDQRGPATAFLRELGRGNPAYYRYVTDPGSRAAIDFGVFGVPETFIIDRDGTVVAKITGAASPQLLRSALDDAIADRRPDSVKAGPAVPAPTGGKNG